MAAQNQATDRAHRIGQEKQVSVFKLIMKDTVEEDVYKRQDQEDSVNVSAEEISLRADGNIGAKDKVLLTETKNAALEAENIYLKNQGNLNLSKAEAAAAMELEVSGNLTSAGTTVKADHLSVNADNADLKTCVNEMTGAVSGNLVLENEGSLSVKDRLQAGDTVEIRTGGGTLDVSGSLKAKNTKLSGADQVRVRVTDQIGNLDEMCIRDSCQTLP